MLPLYNFGQDLTFDRSIRGTLSELSDFTGAVIFSPMMFKAGDLAPDTQSSRLSMEKLVKLGSVATQIKRIFEQSAPEESKNQSDGRMVGNLSIVDSPIAL